MGLDFCLALTPKDAVNRPELAMELIGAIPRRFTYFLLARGGFAEDSAVHQLEQVLQRDLSSLEARLPHVDLEIGPDGQECFVEEAPDPVSVATLLADFHRVLAAMQDARGKWEHILGGNGSNGQVEWPAGQGYLPSGGLEQDLNRIIAVLLKLDDIGVRELSYFCC